MLPKGSVTRMRRMKVWKKLWVMFSVLIVGLA
jgi:hypothetical protein